MEWISVEERLPETIGYYLVIVENSVKANRRPPIEIGELFESVCNRKPILKFQDYITHWMPLPEPPKN